jgi:hypothetical protein
VPLATQAFILAHFKKPAVHAKIRNYLYKWRPLRALLPIAELEALGVPRGPNFDRILERFFEAQLRGKGRTPEERSQLLRKLAGIKPEPKRKKKEEKKKTRARDKKVPPSQESSGAAPGTTPEPAETQPAAASPKAAATEHPPRPKRSGAKNKSSRTGKHGARKR